MNRNPASSSASRFAAESIPASATTMISAASGCCVAEPGQDRDEGLGLGLVALEQVHGQREPRAVGEQPDGDLRVDPAFLGHADLAQPVLARGLEVERGQVVEHQRAARRRGWRGGSRPARSGRGSRAATIALRQRMNVARDGGSDADLAQHADGVELAGRLDDPPQHQRPERLVARPRRTRAPRRPRPGRATADSEPVASTTGRPGIGSARQRAGRTPAPAGQRAARSRASSSSSASCRRRARNRCGRSRARPGRACARSAPPSRPRRSSPGARTSPPAARLPTDPASLSNHIRRRNRSSTTCECR